MKITRLSIAFAACVVSVSALAPAITVTVTPLRRQSLLATRSIP